MENSAVFFFARIKLFSGIYIKIFFMRCTATTRLADWTVPQMCRYTGDFFVVVFCNHHIHEVLIVLKQYWGQRVLLFSLVR